MRPGHKTPNLPLASVTYLSCLTMMYIDNKSCSFVNSIHAYQGPDRLKTTSVMTTRFTGGTTEPSYRESYNTLPFIYPDLNPFIVSKLVSTYDNSKPSLTCKCPAHQMHAQFLFDRLHVLKIGDGALLKILPGSLETLGWESLVEFCKNHSHDASEAILHARIEAFLREKLPGYHISSKQSVSDGGIIDILIEKNGIPCCVIELKKRLDISDDRHQIFRYGMNLIRDNPSCSELPLILFDGINFIIMLAVMEAPTYYPYIYEPLENRIRNLGSFEGYSFVYFG